MGFSKISIIIALLPLQLLSQIVFNGGAKIKISGGTVTNNIFCVLNPPASNPISISGTSDGIIMEDEYNRLQYNLGTTTNSIIVPYMSNLLEQITLTLTPQTAGVGAGNIRFSGKIAPVRATGYDNVFYMPSDVVNMGSIFNTNNSNMTIDRFWIIDANNYTTKPSVKLDFTYIDAEWAVNSGNAITESNLRAQRFNNVINDWEGYVGFLPTGTINISNNTVVNVNVPSADFYRSWTLNDLSKALPIELISFTGDCVDNKTVLNWQTATEKNCKYFTIYSSIDGYKFTPIKSINSEGNSSVKRSYSYTDSNNYNSKTIYYKLTETETNNTVNDLKTISIDKCMNYGNSVTITNNLSRSLFIYIVGSNKSKAEVKIHNALGQLVHNEMITIEQDLNNYLFDLINLPNGAYYVTVSMEQENPITNKIIISDN